MFDVQVKRLHEYKRQTLNLLGVVHVRSTNTPCDKVANTFIKALSPIEGLVS